MSIVTGTGGKNQLPCIIEVMHYALGTTESDIINQNCLISFLILTCHKCSFSEQRTIDSTENRYYKCTRATRWTLALKSSLLFHHLSTILSMSHSSDNLLNVPKIGQNKLLSRTHMGLWASKWHTPLYYGITLTTEWKTHSLFIYCYSRDSIILYRMLPVKRHRVS